MARWAGDDDLVRAARNGDEGAFTRLLERHRAWVCRLMYTIVRDSDQAEDLTQDAFCRVYRHLEHYTEQDRFIPWLKRIAVNLARNSLRDQKRQDALTEHIGKEPMPLGLILDPAAELEARLLQREVGIALEGLSQEHRQAFTLHYFAGLSVQEIALRTDCPPGTIKSRLFHARRQVRHALQNSVPSGGE
jgi:RNA polymerase sigma-70 factor, ECF subfamily